MSPKHRLYLPADYEAGQTLTLPDAAAHYLTRVLRLGPGDRIEVFDGAGHAALAELVSVSKKRVEIEILAHLPDEPIESPLHTVLAQGISRGERMDWTLQKATELGVTAIQPLLTARCEVKLKGDRLARKQAHWQQVVISACEQSGRRVMPEVKPPVSLANWLAQSRTGIVLDPSAEQAFSQLDEAPRPLHVLVGPEGGLTDEEVMLAHQAGLTPVRLGPRVLRTETAGCALLAAVQARWGDW